MQKQISETACDFCNFKHIDNMIAIQDYMFKMYPL